MDNKYFELSPHEGYMDLYNEDINDLIRNFFSYKDVTVSVSVNGKQKKFTINGMENAEKVIKAINVDILFAVATSFRARQ